MEHLHLDIAHAVRELSKACDEANMAAYKEMYQVIKFVLDTRDLGLEIESIQGSKQPWELVCCSDSDYAGDQDSKRSILALYFVWGLPISWRSKAQQSVALLNSEVE